MIRKKPRTNPDKANTGNIYLDAAIEALKEARKQDESLNFALFTGYGNQAGCICEGDVARLAAYMSQLAKEHEDMRDLIHFADRGVKILDGGEDFMNDLIDTVKAARNDVEKMNNELKKLLNESRRKK